MSPEQNDELRAMYERIKAADGVEAAEKALSEKMQEISDAKSAERMEKMKPILEYYKNLPSPNLQEDPGWFFPFWDWLWKWIVIIFFVALGLWLPYQIGSILKGLL